MIQTKEIQDAIYNLVKDVEVKTDSIKVIAKAISLLDAIKLLNESDKHEMTLTEEQKEELQTELSKKTLLLIEKASKKLTCNSLMDVESALGLLRKLI